MTEDDTISDWWECVKVFQACPVNAHKGLALSTYNTGDILQEHLSFGCLSQV